MTITDYAPSEIEIKSLGIGLIDNEYLDLTSREYFVIGDMYSNIETGLNIGQQHSYYWSDTCNMMPKDILYTMIVNNNGIGINTSRNQFNNKFLNNNLNGIYIEKGDIFCDGTISARNIKIINEDGIPYIFNDYVLNNSENIVNNLITAINSNITLANFYQGWSKSYLYNDKSINKNNIFTNSFINIGAGDIDTIDNLHAINIISPAQTNTIENIQIAIKNRTLSQPISYENSAGERVLIKEPSSLRMGIIGMNNESPAIISTTYGMPLEFHIGKSSLDINKLYQDSENIILKKDIPDYSDIENIPAMTITSKGIVSIGNTSIYENINENIDPKFQVSGVSLFDKIYKNDEITGQILELDNIYVRNIGNIIKASNIEAGDFGDGDYRFICNLNISKDLNIDGVFNVNNLITNKIDSYEIITEKIYTEFSDNEISQFNNPSIFTNIVDYENDVKISGSLFYNNYRLNALSVEKIVNVSINEDGSILPQFADLTQDDLNPNSNIILYYGFNSNNNIYPSGSNLAIAGRLGIGITETDGYNKNKLIIKNDTNEDFEILIEDSEILNQETINKSYLGHIDYNSQDINDKSFIINTNPNTMEKRNIYFYPGIEKNQIINNEIQPAFSICENNNVGINQPIDHLNIHTLDINGTLLTDDIYIKDNNGNINKIYNFIDNNTQNSSINTIVLNNNNINSKYFINYLKDSINKFTASKSKGFNVYGGINSKSDLIDSNGGYFENNIKLATFKYINANNTSFNNHPKTSYINTNIIIGIKDISDAGKESFVSNTDISKPLIIRNTSERNYNDSIVRLYRGIINRTENLNDYNSAKYTGIDFCEWLPSIGNRDKDRWYIYRNHDNLIQTIDNYSGVFEIGYSDNKYHTNKSGLEIFYRRNNENTILSSQSPTEDDPQNYYFVFNRPKTERIDSDYIKDIKNKKTVEIYGDLDIHGNIFINGTLLQNIGSHTHNSGNNIDPNIENVYHDLNDIKDDIEITGKNLGILHKNRTIIGDYDVNTIDMMNDLNENNNNNIIFYTAEDKSVSSFISPYKQHTSADMSSSNKVKFDIKLSNFYKNDYEDNKERYKTFDTSIVNFILMSTNNYQEVIKDDADYNYESIFSIENKKNKMISFYNNTENAYINIGNHKSYSQLNKLNNICLHIEDTSEYLLQLSNNDSYKNSKVVLHNKSNSNKNHFWTIDAPNNDTNNFNIKYSNNNDGSDNILSDYNLDSSTNFTITDNNKIGINNSIPLSTLDINSYNNSILNLKNYYIENDNLELSLDEYDVIKINNTHITFINNINYLNNLSIINFDYNASIEPNNIPSTTISDPPKIIYETIKQSTSYIKNFNKKNTNTNKLNIIIYKYTELFFSFDTSDNKLLHFWDFDTKININENNFIEINNNILFPTLKNFPFHINDKKWNFEFSMDLKNNFTSLSLENSNFIISYDHQNTDIPFIIKNQYKYIDSTNWNINYNLVNIAKNYDTNNDKFNLHCTFINKIFKNDNEENCIYLETYWNSNYNQLYNVNIYTSNELYIDSEIKDSETQHNYNIDISYEIQNEYNFNINGPSTIIKDETIYTDIIKYEYDYINSENIYDFKTYNYLNTVPIGINTDSINITNDTITKNIIYNYTNQDIIQILGETINLPILLENTDINVVINNIFDKYYENDEITHFIITNIVEDKAHITFENEILGQVSSINNEIYSTFEGNLVIKSKDNTTQNKNDLIEFTTNNNIKAKNSSLYIKDVYVDNIFDRVSGNSIINSLEKKELNETHTTDNFIMKTINQNFITSNKLIHLTNIENLNAGAGKNDILKIKKTADYEDILINTNITYNNVLEITANNSLDIHEKNLLSLSILNSTSIANFGSSNNPAKVGIGMSKEDINHFLDVNGDLRLTTNNMSELETPHIVLNSHRNNSLFDYYGIDKYNNNLIYSTDGEFKITAYNYLNRKSKDLIKLNNGKVEFEELETTKIIANNIYDNLGNSYFPDFHNLNNKEFLYNVSNLHIVSSNVQFTTSNFNIALENIKDNCFSINKVRPIELKTVLINNISIQDFDDIIYNNTNNIYSSFIQKTQNEFYSSSLNNLGGSIINLHNSSYENIISGVNDQLGYVDGIINSELEDVNNPLFNNITSIIYSSDNYIYIADNYNNRIRFLDVDTTRAVGQVRSFQFPNGQSDIESPLALFKNNNSPDQSQNNILYVSTDKYIYSIDISDIDANAENLTYTLIAGNPNSETGYKDGSLLESKFKNINTIYHDYVSNILYISDDNYSLRIVDIDNDFVQTIAGFLPNDNDNLSFSGSTLGDGIDSRFNNIIKIIKIPNKDYLIILDNESNNSRVLAYDIINSFVSLIYQYNGEVNDIILDISDNKKLYLIKRSGNFIQIIIEDEYENIYNKNIITFHESDNNIFRITSIPHDSINYPYYSLEKDFNPLQLVDSMTVRTNYKNTFVKFGSDDIYKKAFIGISKEPIYGTELDVNGLINTINLNVNDTFTSLNMKGNTLKIKYLENYDTDNINIILNSSIKTNGNNFSLGNYDNPDERLKDIYIRNNLDIDRYRISVDTEDNFIKFTDTLNGDNFIKTKQKGIIFHNNTYNSKSIIDYSDNKLNVVNYDSSGNQIQRNEDFSGLITTLNIDVNNTLHSFEGIISNLTIYEDSHFNSNVYIYNALNVNSNIIANNDIICNGVSYFKNDIIVDNRIITNDIYVSSNILVDDSINVNGLLTSSNIDSIDIYIQNNAIINNDLTIMQELFTSNEVHFYSNLTIYENLIVKDTITSSNLNIIGNTTTINTISYETENLHIINDQGDGPSLKITHNKKAENTDDGIIVINNKLEDDTTNKKIIVNDSCYLGINVDPKCELDVQGEIQFTEKINNVTKLALNYIEMLDEPILDKISDTSNYIEKIDLASSNFTDQVYDYLKYVSNLDVLNYSNHPIIKEFDNDGNIIDNYNIKTLHNNNIYYKSQDNNDEYYIVLRNDTEYTQKHYQLSLVDNILSDILLVGGGGTGINSIYNDIYLNNRNKTIQKYKEINFNNIYLFDISYDYIYYYNNTSIRRCKLGDDLSTNENIIIDIDMSYNYTNSIMKVSKNDELLVINKDNSILIYNFDKLKTSSEIAAFIEIGNDISGNINGNFNTCRFSNIISFAINSKNNVIYIVESNNIRKIDLINQTVSTIFTFTLINSYKYIVITNDDNFLYLSYYDTNYSIIKLNLKNLHQETIIANITYEIQYLSLDKINNKYLLYNNDFNIHYYNTDNNESIQLTKYKYNDNDIIYKYFNFTYDNNSIIYLTNLNNYNYIYIYYFNFNFNNILPINLPAPGSAGSVLFRKDLILNKGIYDLYIGKNLSPEYYVENYNDYYSLNDNFNSQLILWLEADNIENEKNVNLSNNTTNIIEYTSLSELNYIDSPKKYYKINKDFKIKYKPNQFQNNLNYFIIFKNTSQEPNILSKKAFYIKIIDYSTSDSVQSTREFAFHTNSSGKLTNYKYNVDIDSITNETVISLQHNTENDDINILNIQMSENSNKSTKFFINNVNVYDDNNSIENAYNSIEYSELTIGGDIELINTEFYEIIVINRNLDDNERNSLYNNLYYKYNNIKIPKIIKTNVNGYNTNGFGAIVYGGCSAIENYNNINIPGIYKGYDIINNYVLTNDKYNNIEFKPEITNGGAGYSDINYDNDIYNGYKGFEASFINSNDLSELPKIYGYGAPSYDINKNQYGISGNDTNINQINLNNYNYQKTELIYEQSSGTASSGGINNIFSKYPLINNSIYKNTLRLATSASYFDDNIYTINIKIDIKSKYNIKIIDSKENKYINIDIELDPGEYKIIVDNDINKIQFCDIDENVLQRNDTFGNIIDLETSSSQYSNWIDIDDNILNNNNLFNYNSIYSTIQTFNYKLIILQFIEILTTSSLSVIEENTDFYYTSDELTSGSGVIILKYNLKKDVINIIEDKFDKRLKLLEETLLFSRINSYEDNNYLMFFKEDNYEIYYNNMYIDQSYTGLFVDLSNKNSYNTVEENFIFKWKIKYNFEDTIKDVVPNNNSLSINFITKTHIVKFVEYIYIPSNKFLYIDEIYLQINDIVYNYNNNAYISNIEYKNTIHTPIINDIFPINNFNYNNNNIIGTLKETIINNNLIKWSSDNGEWNSPLNIFNHNISHGEWNTNIYTNGIYDIIPSSLSIININNNYLYGEWISITFENEITLTSIDIILHDDIHLIKWYFGGRNDSESNFDSIIDYNSEKEVTISRNITIESQNKYKTFILLVSEINSGKTQLKIKNIKLYGKYKNWNI